MTKEEVLNFIIKRRSIRNYTDKAISEEAITILLKAAMSAPSAKNVKPWSFVVVTEKVVLEELAQAHPNGKMLAKAPLSIVVTGDLSEDYWIQDCSASAQNILLAASGMGLGAVWLGVYPREDRIKAVREILQIPDDIGILCLLSIGYPEKELPPRTQYDPNKIHRNKW